MVGDTPSRRRRRTSAQVAGPPQDSSSAKLSAAETHDEPQNDDYYDDYSESESKGGQGSRDEKIYGGACSFGQFVLNPCRCMIGCSKASCQRLRRRLKSSGPLPRSNGTRSSRQDQRRKIIDWVDVFLVIAVATFSLVFVYCLFPGLFSTTHIPQRPRTDTQVNRIPLSIPCYDFTRWNSDIGGWQFFHHFFVPKSSVRVDINSHRHYDSLSFHGDFGKPRELRHDDAEIAEEYLAKMHTSSQHVSTAYDTAENIQDIERKCQRQSWMELYNPSCNAIHELDLAYDFDEERAGLGDDQMFDSFYISSGYWRDVWVVNQVQQNVKSILKMSRWRHHYDMEIFKYTLNDALVMERLTKSPRIVDVFGHCGFSVWVEAIPYEVEEVVVPGEGFIKQEDLHDEEELQPKNDYTEEEKLEMALTMAESIADLHGFEDGLMIHDDIQICQWLQTRDGHLKLGDFNRAEFPLFDPVQNEYCKYNNGHGYGNYRSPEEFAANDLDEKIDVFSFGNNIYGLLTGLWVFYENEDDGVVHKKLKKGETAFIDDRYRTHSFITGKLVEVMEKCWAYEPEDRIEIFEAVRMLRLARKEYYEKIKSKEGKLLALPDKGKVAAAS